MFQLRLRHALAALTLAFAATFAAVPGADAAVRHPGAGPAQTPAVQKARGSWLRDAWSHVLRKAGIEIDPNGLVDSLLSAAARNGHG